MQFAAQPYSCCTPQCQQCFQGQGFFSPIASYYPQYSMYNACYPQQYSAYSPYYGQQYYYPQQYSYYPQQYSYYAQQPSTPSYSPQPRPVPAVPQASVEPNANRCRPCELMKQRDAKEPKTKSKKERKICCGDQCKR